MASALPKTARINLTAWNSRSELVRIIALLALPVTITNSLQILLGFVDTRMVSPLGETALAAMSVGRSSTMFLMAVFMGLGVGITAYVSRLTGAGEHEKARSYATIGVLSGGVLGAIMMAIGLLIGPAPAHLMVTSQGGGVSPADAYLARQYVWDIMRIMFVSLGGIGMQVAAVSVFNSLGRTTYPMWLLIMNNVTNLIGNYLLIPRYKVAGSAASTAITIFVAAVVAIIVLTRDGTLNWDWEYIQQPFRRAWDMLKIGLPVTIQQGLRSFSMIAVIKLITFLPNSVVGQSALQVGLQAESLAFMPAFAFSIAAATLVGQNLGARNPQQARTSAIYCLIGSQLVMWSIGTLLFLYPAWFVRLFIGHAVPEVVEPAANFLRILALCLPGLGAGMTIMGVLRGSGDTLITALISLVAMWGIRLPLAALLALDNINGFGLGLNLGLSGIWWAMTLSVYVEAGLAYARFASGRWALVKLAGAVPAAAR